MKKINSILTLILMVGMLSSCSLIPQGNHNNNNSNPDSSDNGTNNPDNGDDNNNPHDGGNNNPGGGDEGGNAGPDQEGESDSNKEPEISKPDVNGGLNAHNLANNPQDGTILHAFIWNLNAIKNHLPEIKQAGFSSVQTSPMQPQKDYYPNDHYSRWWKVYQPLGFSVATKNNGLGYKQDLKELCSEADKYGIKVIVDVVANHLAGGGKESFHNGVKDYEPEIYNNNLLHKGYGGVDDTKPETVVKGTIGGFPDLQTESPIVQDAVKDLLREYIDLGVDGFRFDAAKHIEVPEDDEAYRSEFWNVVLNDVNEYATSKGLPKPYHYGEILHTVGDNRKYENYTKRMSVTDSDASAEILNAVTTGNAKDINQKDIYKKGVTSDKAVLWGESHDTYANPNGPTRNISQKDIDKAYAIAASRNNASALYLIRPDNAMKYGGESTDKQWQSNLVSQINKFHNHFLSSSENILETENNYFVNIKNKGDECGAVIVNLTSDNQVITNTHNLMKDGYYIDKVSNTHFQVKNGILHGQTNDSDVAILYPSDEINPNVPELGAVIKASEKDGSVFEKPIDITFTTFNIENATIQVGEGNPQPFTSSKTIHLGENIDDDYIKVKVSGTYNGDTIVKEFSYGFFKVEEGMIKILGVPLDEIQKHDFGIWLWDNSNINTTSRWIKPTIENDVLKFAYDSSDNMFIVATMNKGQKLDWNNKIKQTEDIDLNKNIYSYTEFIWK